MKVKHTIQILSLGAIAVLGTACASSNVALQTNNDDVYFSDVTANKLDYVATTTNDYKSGNYTDRNGYDRNDDYYYDGQQAYNGRFSTYSLYNNYSWRDYYYQDRLGYDPFWGPSGSYGYNNFYGSGLSLSFNLFSSPYSYYGFNNGYYNNYNTSNWNYYGSYYGNSPYWGIYSYYRPGYYGNYGNYGGGYGGGGYYPGNAVTSRANTPRPRGSYDNVRTADNNSSGSIPIPPSSTRPVRPDAYNPGNGSAGRTTDGNGRGSSTNSNPATRPTRPTSTPSSDGSRTSTPTSTPPAQNTRPTRTENSSPPPSSSNSSGSSSSSSGSSGGTTRPTRGGN